MPIRVTGHAMTKAINMVGSDRVLVVHAVGTTASLHKLRICRSCGPYPSPDEPFSTEGGIVGSVP